MAEPWRNRFLDLAFARFADIDLIEGQQAKVRAMIVLEKDGLKIDVTPAEFRAEALVHAISEAGNVGGLRILLPHADIGRELR